MHVNDGVRRRARSYVAVVSVLGGVLGMLALGSASAQAEVTEFGQGDCFCSGVAADSNGVIYAADPNVHQVVQFSATGAVLARWGSAGTSNGQFELPEGLATDSDNNVYVADPERGDVQEFSSNGTFIQKFFSNQAVWAVAVDPNFNVYVAGDTGNIYKYDSSGHLLSTWQSGVSGNPSFSDIRGIAYSPLNGNIYAADVSNDEVYEFTPAGSFVTSWGGYGNSPGELNDPYGLAIDSTGNVYVSQPNLVGTNATMTIEKFTPSGTYVSSYDPPADQPAALSFTSPDLYVAGYTNVARVNLTTPVASIKASNSSVNPGQSVTLSAAGSSLPFGSITNYAWDLDGSGQYATSTGASSSVLDTFATPGTKTVSVRVTGSSGATQTASVTITVPSAPIGPPTATITSPSNGQSYQLGQSVSTSFSCTEASAGPGLASCQDSNGASSDGRLSTSTYGEHTYSVTAVSEDGQKTTTSISYAVAPPGRVGFVIDDGDYATNNRNVTLSPVWPLGATSILVSNNGGFGASGNANSFHLGSQLNWTLEQTGTDRLPKTVYLRFIGAGMDDQNFTDDIILDETAPTAAVAELLNPTANVASIARAQKKPRQKKFKIRVKAADRIAGVCEVEASTKQAGGTIVKIANCKKKGVAKLARAVTVAMSSNPRYLRVRNSAGTWSHWRKVTQR